MQAETVEALQAQGVLEAPDFSRMSSQQAFLSDNHRFKMLSGSFATGKTTALCAHVVFLMTHIPGNQGYLGRLEGKRLRQSTLEVLLDQLPAKSYTKNDQQGKIRMKPEFGGSTLWFGDFKEHNKLKNMSLGFFAIDQAEEVSVSIWSMMAGRLRLAIPLLTPDGQKQYAVQGGCPRSPFPSGRHYAFQDSEHCELCRAILPSFRLTLETWEKEAPWILHCYPQYGLGACNPEGPSHWIYQMFPGLPGMQGEVSQGTDDPDLLPLVKAFSSTTDESYRANLIQQEYYVSLKAKFHNHPNMYARYVDGRWVDAEGRVYPEFNPDLHVISPHAKHHRGDRSLILESAQCYEYIDHGATSPTAVGWVVIEDCDCGCEAQNYYVINEHYEAGKPVSHHANAIKLIRSQIPWTVKGSYLDSAAFGRAYSKTDRNNNDRLWAISDEYIEHGIIVSRSQKDWDAGQNRISELLLNDPTHIHPVTGQAGAPHLFVFDNCPHFIYEMLNYKWKTARRKDLEHVYHDEPIDYDDHHMDGLNGLLTSRPSPRGLRIATHLNRREAWWIKEFRRQQWRDSKLTHMSF